jgi:hypothetical protein
MKIYGGMNMINLDSLLNSFIGNLFSTPFILFLLALVFNKQIGKKIEQMSSFKKTKNGFEAIFDNINKTLDSLTGKEVTFEPVTNKSSGILGKKSFIGGNKEIFEMKQPVKSKSNKHKNSNYAEIAIPRIYVNLETEVKKKFNISDDDDMINALLKKQNIDDDILVVLDSMRKLRENIHSYVQEQTITEKDIGKYDESAKRILNIIEAIQE